MDNIRDGTSTISHTGRGAFANRKLLKGSSVSPVPLLHFYEKNYFVTYEITDYSREPNQTAPPVHSQPIQNYCFGHPQSQLMLCPLLTAFINHAHEEKPNIKIEWSKSASMRHPEWKDMPLDK
jgi:hypothetical protein